MTALQGTIGSALDGLLRRLEARSQRLRQACALEAHVVAARRRYHGLGQAERQELRRAARRLPGVRDRMAALTGSPTCCSDCAQRMARVTGEPAPALSGGHCCGGEMGRIFDELEVAALWLAGRAPSRRGMVRRPKGCHYRGPRGCLLDPCDRPSICSRYLCSELTEALSRSGALPDILECADQLEVEMARIAELLQLRARQ